MFFSPDLLSKRDSGFGLLWLAATLGPKSAFKKLPKRSVMTADISQLCRLIATPAEPLALRLSSNLLVGAARVYRVKQEILMSDVIACYNSLKRVEHEFRSISSDVQLQMAQPSVKSSAVTLRADPRAALFMDFDAMITNWDEYLNLGGSRGTEDGSDGDYHPITTKTKGKVVAISALAPNSEFLRATACTLSENHDFLLANSFDASFGGSGITKHTSSQIGGFAFDDTFDGLDIGEGVGDDLVRELGEGWGASPVEDVTENFAQDLDPFTANIGSGDLDDGMVRCDGLVQDENLRPDIRTSSIQALHHDSARSPPLADGTSLLVELALHHAQTRPINLHDNRKKTKRARPLLDIRTELTDEELKATRIYYLNRQNAIRFELEFKKFEKMQVDLIHGLLWDAPGSVHAKELVDFWVDHFKAHVEARSGLFVDPQWLDDSPRQKRRKVSVSPPQSHMGNLENAPVLIAGNWHTDHEIVQPRDGSDAIELYHSLLDGLTGNPHSPTSNGKNVDDHTPSTKNLRSSEEPGQARRASPLPTFGDSIGANVTSDTFQSQRSALFPWDMAGGSSSISVHGEIQLPSNDRISVEHADARLRGSSTSRRGSSALSLPGNLQTYIGSPAAMLYTIQSDDDFIFDVPGDNNRAPEPQQPEASRVALEKNSYNFLEYAKMQCMSLPSTQYLVFDVVVPKTTSTARVAAAALYHCLVLTTKNHLQVKQEEPYGRIEIRIVY